MKLIKELKRIALEKPLHYKDYIEVYDIFLEKKEIFKHMYLVFMFKWENRSKFSFYKGNNIKIIKFFDKKNIYF